MVLIQQPRSIPEVRLYPPETEENEDRNDNRNSRNSTPQDRNLHSWLPLIPPQSCNRWSEAHSMPPPDSLAKSAVMENWNPFHMRPANLMAFTACQHVFKNSYRSHGTAIQRARSGWISSAAKSLDLLRQNLQQVINKELDDVIKRYIEKFFTPAVENIKRNNGDNAVSEEHIHTVCKQMLEEAKRMYTWSYTRGSTPLGENSDSETGSHYEGRLHTTLNKRKRRDSDTDSEASQVMLRPFKKKGRPPLLAVGASGRLTPSKQTKGHDHPKKEGPKWDPGRLTKETYFIMGARANKALGFGATRGRLYIKHPDLFKYCGDAEDKQWLYDNNMMPATGGKAYMLILEDIKELIESDEYRNSPGLLLDELLGFSVPNNMLEKMKVCMNSQRTDLPERRHRGRPPLAHAEATTNLRSDNKGVSQLVGEYSGENILKSSGLESSAPASPIDDLDILTRGPSSTRPSSFTLPDNLVDVNSTAEASPSSSTDLQSVIDTEPPLSAPFDIMAVSLNSAM